VLNTKEFYQGILTPIPMKMLSYYINIGFPEYLLLSLVVSEVEFGSSGARKHIYNIPDEPIDVAGVKTGRQFSDLLRLLIGLGLTVEEVEQTTPLGRPFGADKYPSPTDLVSLDAKNIRVVSLDRARFQLVKSDKNWRFCFEPTLAHGAPVYAGMPVGETGERLPARLLCGATRDRAAAAPADDRTPRPSSAKPAKPAPADQPAGAGAGNDLDDALVIRTHSTEGVIYYLGEIARHQLGLVPTANGNWDPNIFHLREGAGGPGAITATYEGRDYHINVDPTGADRSSQVLDLVTELLAQNNSAKDLPQPSVIPIVR